MTAIHAFIEANAPFFTWTVFVASVAVGLVLWAVSGLWRLMVAFWKWLDPYELPPHTTTYGLPGEVCEVCGDAIQTFLWLDATGAMHADEQCPTCKAEEA